MPSEIERSVAEYGKHLRDTTPEIRVQEIYARAGSGAASADGATGDRRSWLRWSTVAASLVLVVAASFVYVRGDAGGGTVVTPTDSATPSATVAPSPLPVASSAPTTTPPTSLDAVIVQPDTTITPEATADIEDVQAGQRDALRRLPGFSATVVAPADNVTSNDLVSDPIRYTLLADGSFYAETGPGTFGSYDPSTNVMLGAYRDMNGDLAYQETVGQPDNSTALNILAGYDPTQPIGAATTLEDATVRVVDVEGRQSWEVTATNTYPNRTNGESGDAAKIVQTTVQVVDIETGLIVSSITASTDPNVTGQQGALSNIEIVDRMPAEFPGAFPPDASVDRSGNPNAARPATLDDVARLFNRDVPVPAGMLDGDVGIQASNATITINEFATYLATDDLDPDLGPSAINRQAEFTVREGFVATTVVVSATALADGRNPGPDTAAIDGYICNDFNADGACDPPPANAPGVDFLTATDGALTGSVALLNDEPVGNVASLSVGPFNIYVHGGDLPTIRSIVNTFRTITPD